MTGRRSSEESATLYGPRLDVGSASRWASQGESQLQPRLYFDRYRKGNLLKPFSTPPALFVRTQNL
jgi:hypothetical protein